jgi:hypothetical protein
MKRTSQDSLFICFWTVPDEDETYSGISLELAKYYKTTTIIAQCGELSF